MLRIGLDEARKLRRLEPWEMRYVEAIAFTLSPDPEDSKFELVTYYGESLRELNGSRRKPEWIYVLMNKLCHGILKIGYTSKSIYQRVNEINSATGVISPWIIAFGYKCIDGYQLEQELHRYLENKGIRINPKREGFELEIDDAIDIIEEIGARFRALS
jgi:T5orf172 domain-containing protein